VKYGPIVVAMAVDIVVHSRVEVERVVVVEDATVWAVELDLAVMIALGIVRVAVHFAAQCMHKSRTPLGQQTVMNHYLT
jgi:hypothetical protein